MTDATADNKGVAPQIAEIMARVKAAGQLFCNPIQSRDLTDL